MNQAMNKLSTRDPEAIKAELRKLPTDQLRTFIADCIGKTADFVYGVAMALEVMDERKESFTGIPRINVYRKVAAGQLLPELVIPFSAAPGWEDIFRAPIRDQQRIAKNPIVPVAESAEGGGFTTRMVDLTRAPRETVRQVLGDEGIRTPEEQIAYVRTMMRAPLAAPALASRFTDESEPDEPLEHSVTGKVTASEYKAIRIMAAEQGLTLAQVVRRLLLRSGALKSDKRKRSAG